MKIRNGFVSNSSSCSYVVDFGTKVNSAEDLEKILNENFWKDARSMGDCSDRDDKYYDGLEAKFPFKRLCELLFRLMQESPEDNGQRLLERLLEDTPVDLPSFPRFRANFLRSVYGKKYYKNRLKSEYLDDRFEVEEEIWNRYKGIYDKIFKADKIEEMKENPQNIAYFSFGNESEYFNKGEDRFSQDEVYMIGVLRNYGLVPVLFWGLHWEAEDYS